MKKYIIALMLVFVLVRYPLAQVIGHDLEAYIYYVGLQFNQKFDAQGSSLGVSFFGDFTYTKTQNNNILKRKGADFILSLNHHFHRGELKRIMSQTIALQIPFMKIGNRRMTPLGLGVEVRHYDFRSFEVSPKVYLMTPFFAIYGQYNFLIRDKHNQSLPKLTFGVEMNTNYVLGFLAGAMDYRR